LKELLNITFQGELNKESVLEFLGVPTAPTSGLFLKSRVASLTVLMNPCPAVICAEEAKEFVDCGRKKVFWEEQAEEAKERAKGLLREVSCQEEDKETAEGILEGDRTPKKTWLKKAGPDVGNESGPSKSGVSSSSCASSKKWNGSSASLSPSLKIGKERKEKGKNGKKSNPKINPKKGKDCVP